MINNISKQHIFYNNFSLSQGSAQAVVAANAAIKKLDDVGL